MPFDSTELDSHRSTCSGRDAAMAGLSANDVDKIIAIYDERLADLYIKMHLFCANYLQATSHGTCAIVETTILKLALKCIDSIKPDDLDEYLSLLEFNKKTIMSQSAHSQADSSFLIILESFTVLCLRKSATIKTLPQKIRSLLVKIKEVDSQTYCKLEELKLWKSKCYTMSAMNGLTPGRPSVIVKPLI